MVVRKEKAFEKGYNVITEIHGEHPEMMLDFGILVLEKGDTWECQLDLERAWLLIKGTVEFQWEGKSQKASRFSCFDEGPSVLHVPSGVPVTIVAHEHSELCVERSENEKAFASKFYAPEDTRSDVFGAGVLNEASIRTVRTVFDGEIAPDSQMVLGEVINHPGKWSSYPPHDHPHPEIYHYRLYPQQGFGVSLLDEDPYVVKDGDTTLIFPDKTHSQVAGAGYAMYYIWMIPHLPGDKWLPTTRYFRKEHEWMLDKDVKIWPEQPYQEPKQ
jgi:5-deoxy-glucuronate isomerase